VLAALEGHLGIVLNAPEKLNSLNEAAFAELSNAYDGAASVAAEGRVRALLLRGEGRAFCAGRTLPASVGIRGRGKHGPG
jgi:enoyl-CoA hydratase/carnithine racemase